MEWFGNIRRQVERWLAPSNPSPRLINEARRDVIAATTNISNAYGSRGTAFQVMYQGERFLITSTHLMLNEPGDQLGYHDPVTDKYYYLIMQGDRIAFAEPLVYNPIGAPCTGESFSYPFRDTAIMRIVPPDQVDELVRNLWSSPDIRQRLTQRFSREPQLWQHTRDDRLLHRSEVLEAAQGFELGAIPLNRSHRPWRLSPEAYAIGNRFNEHEPLTGIGSTITRGTRDTSDDYLHFRATEGEEERGHSGALLYDVDMGGNVIPLGVIVGRNVMPITQRPMHAVALPFAAIYRGLDIATGRVEIADLTMDRCSMEDVPDMAWQLGTLDAPTTGARHERERTMHWPNVETIR